MITNKFPKMLRRVLALLLTACIVSGPGTVIAYTANGSITVSVGQETIKNGTVDPIIYVNANAAFDPESVRYIYIDTSTTGLTATDIVMISDTQLAVYLRGTAREGVISIFLDGNAFLEGSDEEFELMVKIRHSITASAFPQSINSGTVDPVIYMFADGTFDPDFVESIRVDTGTTGLTAASIEVNKTSGSQLVIRLKGTAQEGTILIVVEGDVWEGDNIVIPVLPVVVNTFTVTFDANNGTGQTFIASVNSSETYLLPECMFDALEGQKFAAWSIGGDEYLPGDSYILSESTFAEALWHVDYEERIENAVGLVEQYVAKMTEVDKEDPTGIDRATLYAEAVVADAISADAGTGAIYIDRASSSELATLAAKATKEAEAALIRGGVTPHRDLFAMFTLNAQQTDIQVQILPDVLESGADRIRVQTSKYALTFKASDLEDDLTKPLTFKARSVNAAIRREESAVNIEISGGSIANPITAALPTDSGEDDIYQTLADLNGNAVASKVNPVTGKMEGKVSTSGTYKEITHEVNFTDIANKSAEMQKAIKYLAARDILGGTGDNKFSPDASISRAELTKLVVMALGKLDNGATSKFADVTKSDWFYSVVASSQKLGYIGGYEDNTFRGKAVISKNEIVVIAGRVLSTEMNYKTPSNTTTYLGKYSDTVATWAQPQVALATRENLIVYRTDGTFSGAKDMTRGDAAIVLYRLFQKLW